MPYMSPDELPDLRLAWNDIRKSVVTTSQQFMPPRQAAVACVACQLRRDCDAVSGLQMMACVEKVEPIKTPTSTIVSTVLKTLTPADVVVTRYNRHDSRALPMATGEYRRGNSKRHIGNLVLGLTKELARGKVLPCQQYTQ